MKLLLLAAFVVAASALPFADLFEDVLGKPDTKVGSCPQIPDGFSFGICSTICEVDSHCDGGKKCCQTPCGGTICIDPVPEQPELPKAVPTPEEISLTVEEQWVCFVEKKRETVQKLRDFPAPPTFFQKLTKSDEALRFCTSTLCEWKKCTRMANTFTYSLKPRKEWACALATSPQHCMAWIEQGHADVMITRDEDVFVAKTKFNLLPVAYESVLTKQTPPSEWQNITLAVARLTSNIETWSDMRNRYSCHSAANSTASFKTPIGSLIQQGIIPRKGDVVESAAEFFRESCVPDILNRTTFNKNGTYPYSLEARCDHEDQVSHGSIEGAVRCLRENRGDVMFVDHKKVKSMLLEDISETQYKLICKSGSQPLSEWETKDCHISKVPQPTLYISPKKIELKRVVQEIFTQAVQTHNSKSVGVFKLFSSEEYNCPLAGPNRDLIFKDESNVFINIDETIKPHAVPFFTVMETIEKLVPKPTARFCVTTVPMYEGCRRFKGMFEQIESTKNIAWGCVLAESKMECMKTVLNGSAELMTANATEIFTAGQEFKLQPFLSQQFDTLTPSQVGDKTKFENNTYTYTIGVMLKEKLYQKYGNEVRFLNMTGLKTCHAGISELSSFKHPIGWLLANGTIPRIGSVFESVSRFFNDTCLPGAAPRNWTWDRDLILGQELNWGFPGLSFFNFTGYEWFSMNAPNTWNYYNWKGMSPKFFNVFFKDLKKDEIKEYLADGGLARLPILARLMSAVPRSLKDLSYRLDQLPEEILGLNDELLTPRGQQGQTKLGGNLDALLQRLQARNQMKHRDWTKYQKYSQDNREQEDPILSALFNRLNGQRFNFEDQLSEVMEYIHQAPSMIDFKLMENSWINHPAIKSFLQVYSRRFVNVDLFDNLEVREQEFNRYFNPLWLSPRIGEFLETTKAHQEKLCRACAGAGVSNCTETPEEPFSGFRGSLECLKRHGGEIAFLEAHTARSILREAELRESEVAMVCRSGEVIDFTTNEEILKRCSFGEVPYPAIMTAYNKTGSWRWNVTKAFLEAQKQYNLYQISDFAIQNPRSFRLQPVSLINQTYEVYLQPMLLRSFEALVKPSSYDWWKENTNVCSGETYTNVLTQRNGTCNAIVKDVTCTGTPTPIVMSVGRIGEKKKVLVPMCSRPTRFVRQLAEYTCETGATYLKTTMVPTACECVPCEEFSTQPSWNNDYFWHLAEHEYTPTQHEKTHNLWGNAEFWSDRSLTRNFDLQDAITNLEQTTRIGQTTLKKATSCEKPWIGDKWQQEWFPQQSSVPVCEQKGKTQAVETIKAILQLELEKEL